MSLPPVTPLPSTHRLWIRREKPLALPWQALIGFMALLLVILYGLLPFAHNDIETSVTSGTRAALDARGFGWVQIATSGQDVVLSGVQPESASGNAAMAVARAATCPTWAGRLACPIEVIGQFSNSPAPAVAAVAPSTDDTPAQTAACEKSFNDIVARSQIEFAPGSAEIRRSEAILDALAKAAADCGDGVLRVEGHTDSIGSASVNVALSAARANAVAAALIVRGIPRARLVAQGFGATRPIADNLTPDGRAKNRRIEFRVVQRESN